MESVSQRRRMKPTMFWLLLVSNIVVAGLIPMVSAVMMYHQSEGELSTAWFAASVLLSGAIIASALGTLYLDNFSRYAFLVLSSIYWTVIFITSLDMIIGGKVDERNWGMVYGGISRALFWVALNWWYLKRTKTEALFES